MKFKLEPIHRNIPDGELTSDLLKIKEQLNKETVTQREYAEFGKYSTKPFLKRFGSWNKALEKSDLSLIHKKNISEEDLFKNIEEVWIKLGRQPRFTELKNPLSIYSGGTYSKRFGGWGKALNKFIDYINTEKIELKDEPIDKPEEIKTDTVRKHKTKRKISDRLRFRILMRDGFTCKKCGKSPIRERDVELHVDHILPWSKGGETVPENLETKCKKCNLGKGNAFDV